jgi:hypothetical protein
MMEQRQPLQQMLLGKMDICLQKTETRSMFADTLSCTSINSKWIKDLNIKLEILKLVQEKTRNTLEAVGTGFLCRTQVAQQIRERINKWNYMKYKSFCTTKEMDSKLKRLPTEWEKIFVSYAADKRQITRINRELKKLNSRKINDPIKKWATKLKKTFSKEEVQRAKKHIKNDGKQIKTTVRFHLTPIRIATIKNTNNNKCWQGCRGERNTHSQLVGM